MAGERDVGEAFRLLQAGRAADALRSAGHVARADPGNARAHLAAGIALRMLGQLDASRSALELAARLAPADYAVAFELGRLLESSGQADAALAHFERAAELRPGFAPAHFSIGMAHFDANRWPRAIAAFERVLALDATNVAARMSLASALAEVGELARARSQLEQAAAGRPSNPAIEQAFGRLLEREGRLPEALAAFDRAGAGAPEASDVALARARILIALGRPGEAVDTLTRVVRSDARTVTALRAQGHSLLARAQFEAAAAVFSAACEQAPADVELPMFAAQAQLLLGAWREAWSHYSSRPQRRAFENARKAGGEPYSVPSLAQLAQRDVLLVGEQGLGDNLFFLRFAPALVSVGARVSFAGNPRLHPLLARTGLFTALEPDDASIDRRIPILVGDLPLVLDPSRSAYLPSLRIPPDPARLAAWRTRLAAAGPRPWIGVTWRAGTPREVFARGLSKSVPSAELFGALRRVPGTVLALQRDASRAEIDEAARVLGRPVADLSSLGEDLDDVLAVVALLDRHIAVSSTNLHLAAAVAATADVLVPFPPEWRWRIHGDSPWFPGFRVLRQAPDADWSQALAQIAGSRANERSDEGGSGTPPDAATPRPERGS